MLKSDINNTHIPLDCWSVIVEFISCSSTFINIYTLCKTLKKFFDDSEQYEKGFNVKFVIGKKNSNVLTSAVNFDYVKNLYIKCKYIQHFSQDDNQDEKKRGKMCFNLYPRFRNVRTLRIDNPHYSTEYTGISKLEKIEELYLDQVFSDSLNDSDLIPLKNLRDLKLIYCTGIRGKSFSSLTNITRLTLFSQRKFDKLQQLELFQTSKVSDIHIVKEMKSLRSITLNYCKNFTGENLKNLPCLETVNFVDMFQTKDEERIFRDIKKLKRLSISGSYLHPNCLNGCESVEELTLVICYEEQKDKLIWENLRSMKKLKKLKVDSFFEVNNSSSLLKEIVNEMNLEEFSFSSKI